MEPMNMLIRKKSGVLNFRSHLNQINKTKKELNSETDELLDYILLKDLE